MKTLLSNKMKKALTLGALFIFSASAFAQVTYTDSVCASSQDVVYGISNSDPTSTYSWWLSDPAAGTIDNSFASNDSVIEIDWNSNIGTYTLFAQETSADGCLGDTIQLNIIINPLPTVAVVSDSVCEGFQANLTFDFTGTGPWVVDYTDGTTNWTDTATATPYIVSLPPYTSSQNITVTNLTDANSCAADPSTLPSVPVHIYPKPATGPIYHY